MRHSYSSNFAGYVSKKPWLLKQRRKNTLIALITIAVAVIAMLLAIFAWQRFSQPTLVSANSNDSDEVTDISSLPDYKPLVLAPKSDSTPSKTRDRSSSATVSSDSVQSYSQSQSSSDSDSASSKVQTTNTVEINGKTISVPKNSEVHKKVQSKNGVTKVDISATSNSTSSNNSSLELNVHSSNESSRQVEH
jgi:cytoskeletal protein RodZ